MCLLRNQLLITKIIFAMDSYLAYAKLIIAWSAHYFVGKNPALLMMKHSCWRSCSKKSYCLITWVLHYWKRSYNSWYILTMILYLATDPFQSYYERESSLLQKTFIKIEFTLGLYHELARFGMTCPSYHSNINAQQTIPNWTGPTCINLLYQHGLFWFSIF